MMRYACAVRSPSFASPGALAWFCLPLALAGCGSDDEHRSAGEANGDPATSSTLTGSCNLRAQVSGGTDIAFTGTDDAACLTVMGSESGLDVIFSGAGAKGSLELIVDFVLEGELGEFPARVVVTSTARENWQGKACTATLSEHRLLSTEASTLGELRHYQVAGSGSCSEALESVPTGGASVTVGDFAFRAQFSWRD